MWLTQRIILARRTAIVLHTACSREQHIVSTPPLDRPCRNVLTVAEQSQRDQACAARQGSSERQLVCVAGLIMRQCGSTQIRTPLQQVDDQIRFTKQACACGAANHLVSPTADNRFVQTRCKLGVACTQNHPCQHKAPSTKADRACQCWPAKQLRNTLLSEH